MTELSVKHVTRRNFVIGTTVIGAGLTLGVFLKNSPANSEELNIENISVSVDTDPNAFIHIGTDNVVTVFSKHTEMGQGIYTGLATIVAEELDASWQQIKVEGAGANTELYINFLMGEQATGGSTSISNSYEQLRQAGAAARHMLISAAASLWNIPAEEISVMDGTLTHQNSNNSASFGDLAELAAQQDVPDKVIFKTPDRYRLVGSNLPRTDIPDKINGSAIYTQDFKLPGMLTAMVLHAPRFGATVKSYNDEAAKAINGVVDVVQISSGVVVVARDFWTASTARDALVVQWDESEAFALSSEEIFDKYKEIAKIPGLIARNVGSIESAESDTSKTLEADFEYPFLAHASMEPLNCIVHLREDGCEIWNAAQQQTSDLNDASRIFGLSKDQITVNMLYAGGSSGRRACKDYSIEAFEIAKAVGGNAPIKLVWTREDDMRAGQYRPLNYHKLKGSLDNEGNLISWQHRLVGQSIAAQVAPHWLENGLDSMSLAGANDWLYEVPNIMVDSHSPELPVPVLWYRATSGTHTVYSVEVFINELATLAGRDPVEFRRSLLKNQDRLRNVLDLVAKQSKWRTELAEGRGRGVAICNLRQSFMAQVAEVTVYEDKTYSVDKVFTVIDCGLALNPEIVCTQMEGGTAFGLSSMVGDEITFQNGYVEQENFDTYELLRISQMPAIEVHIVKSTEAPTGIGDLSPMLIGPAVANALASVTGRQYHKLPITSS